MKQLFVDLHCDTLFTLRREACTLKNDAMETAWNPQVSFGLYTEDGLLLESVITECLRWLTGFGTSRITIRMSYCGSLTIVDFRTKKSGASLLRLVHTRWRRSRRPRCVRYCKLFPKGEVRLWMEQYRSAWMLLERRLQYRIRSGGQRCDLYLMLPCRMPSTPCRTR